MEGVGDQGVPRESGAQKAAGERVEETHRSQGEPQTGMEIGSFELGFCPRQHHDFVIKETPRYPQ